jgi:membrane associated rhomboid family serine protease
MDQHGRVLFQQLAAVGPHPQWITVFTSMFMHGGLVHIGGNMLYLWIFGNNIEDALGHVKFLLFYLVCGVLAALAHVYASGGLVEGVTVARPAGGILLSSISAGIPTLGASGAIAGVLGAYVLLFPRSRVHTLIMLGWWWETVDIPAAFVLGVWFLLQLTGTLGTGGLVGGGVAYWAHIGGFVAGAALILILGGKKLTRRPPPRRPWNEDKPYPFRPWK